MYICTPYNIQCRMYIIQFIMYTVKCTVYTVLYIVYIVYCTVYSVLYTVYTLCIQCMLYIVYVIPRTSYSPHNVSVYLTNYLAYPGLKGHRLYSHVVIACRLRNSRAVISRDVYRDMRWERGKSRRCLVNSISYQAYRVE